MFGTLAQPTEKNEWDSGTLDGKVNEFNNLAFSKIVGTLGTAGTCGTLGTCGTPGTVTEAVHSASHLFSLDLREIGI